MEMCHRSRLCISLLLIAGACLQAACVRAHPDAAPQPSADSAAAEATVPSLSDPAVEASIPPGVYATSGGWGQLAIGASETGTVFTLEAENAGDGCHFSGRMQGSRATVYDGDAPSQCVFELGLERTTIDIAASAACDAYCGRNGSYEGRYIRLAPACEPEAVRQARDRFRSSYANGDYADADRALAPVYSQCLANLPMLDEAGVRNDFAVTRHKLGDDAGCLLALEKYRADAARSDDEITENMAPAVAGDYLSAIRTARTNIAMCSG